MLLYVSNKVRSVVEVYSVPGYSKVGQITNGIEEPEGITTDENGDLYVANVDGDSVTIYKPATTSPYRTLTQSSAPDDVAVAPNGDVLTGDLGGGVDVYAPGEARPSTRLTNSAINIVRGVAVDANNNVYAAGTNASLKGVLVEYTGMSGNGKNLGLQDLQSPLGGAPSIKNGPRLSQRHSCDEFLDWKLCFGHGTKPNTNPVESVVYGIYYGSRIARQSEQPLSGIDKTSFGPIASRRACDISRYELDRVVRVCHSYWQYDAALFYRCVSGLHLPAFRLGLSAVAEGPSWRWEPRSRENPLIARHGRPERLEEIERCD